MTSEPDDPTLERPRPRPRSPIEIPGVVLGAEIARGGMGVVYHGEQDYLQRHVAVKVLASHLQDERFAARFQREARILANINHPNIVGCFQAGASPDGLCFMVMEYIDGPTLRDHIDDTGPMAVPDAMAVTRSLSEALCHASAAGIIHRDVKPDNVLLQRPREAPAQGVFPFVAKLVDLGLARTVALNECLTQPGYVVGTTTTMAPEQFDDPDEVDFRADIYGLGCTLYYALCGAPAFPQSSLADILAAKQQTGPDPRTLREDLPDDVAALVQRMLAPDRDDRPASYDAIIAICKRLTHTGESATMVSPSGNDTDPPPPPIRRWLVGAAVLALAGAAAFWWPRTPNTPPTLTIVVPDEVLQHDVLVLRAEFRDPDGDEVTLQWRQVGEPTLSMDDPTAAEQTFPLGGLAADLDLRFEVSANDGQNDVVKTTATVRVRKGQPMFVFDANDHPEGWDKPLGDQRDWWRFGEDILAGRCAPGVSRLLRNLPAGDFRITGEVQPVQGEPPDVTGVFVETEKGTSMLLGLSPTDGGFRAQIGTLDTLDSWPPAASTAHEPLDAGANERLRVAISAAGDAVSLRWGHAGEWRKAEISRAGGPLRLGLVVRDGLVRFHDFRSLP